MANRKTFLSGVNKNYVFSFFYIGDYFGDEITSIISKVKSIALFMDGDPTLHKEVIKFLSYAKEKKVKNK